MSINQIEKFDTLSATVICNTVRKAYLKINDLEDAEPQVVMFDGNVRAGDTILVSVKKISDNYSYIKVSLDSLIQNRPELAA